MHRARWHNISDTGGIILREMSVTKRQILYEVSRIIKYIEQRVEQWLPGA